MIEKKPIFPDELNHESVDARGLASACLDYTAIEAKTAQQENQKHYSKPLHPRLRTGETVLLKVTDIDGDFKSNDGVVITGELTYDKLNFDKPGEVKSSIRIRGRSDTSSGSFMHAVPLSKVNKGIHPDYERPYKRFKAPMVTVESIDLNTDEIKLKYIESRAQNGPYVKRQHRFVSPGDADSEYKRALSEGDGLILEPGYNNHTAKKIQTAMNFEKHNSTIKMFDQLIDSVSDNTTSNFDRDTMDAFVSWLESSSNMLSPNENQKAFIADSEQELVPLQGPPGTGKTSGALAPGIISRILSHKISNPWGLVTGPSHKATNETMESVIEIIDAYQASTHTDDALDDIVVYRLAEEPEDESKIDRDYLTYDALYEGLGTVPELASQLQQSSRTHPVLVFSTPGKAWRLTEQLAKEIVPGDDSIEDIIDEAKRDGLFDVFNVYAADEASMLTLPQFFLAGAQYYGNGAVLVSGDHRQLPPVQKHDWDTEFRPSVRSVAPFLSALDFTRLLTEKSSDVLDSDLAELLHDDLNRSKIGVSFHRLKLSYRNHTELADFLRETVYEKDGIPYQSNQTATISTPASKTRGLNTITRPDEPVVVVTYDDTSSQQSNPTEAVMTAEILDAVREDSIGVVTPHNAQRALVRQMFDSYPSITSRDPDVATVNRFQGGERDVIVMNGTVSDPDYIDSESEFLLNLNRINVALSRMRKKLVVLVAESIFSYIPSDTPEYEQMTVWKSLARVSGVTNSAVDPEWSGTLDDLLGSSVTSSNSRVDPDTNINVYYL